MRRRPVIFAATLAVVALTTVNALVRPRLIGFSYANVIDNRDAECPSTVVSISGDRITLNDGRVLRVLAPEGADLRAAMVECENRVRYDPADEAFYTLRHIGFCGFDFPEGGQLFTIPLKRVDLRMYTSVLGAQVREVPPHRAATQPQ